ncbi:MAG: oxidative damage protection protein [Pseudomonadales bacterium]|nr:oxidative damage protection protein [Pseudomonadales bacterium]
MMRTVNCIKYKQPLEGLEKPPYPGPKGLEIYESVSKKAWIEWTNHQTMLINEKHLNMMDPSSRKLLLEEMDKFLKNTEYAKVEGYVPEKK